MSGTRYRALIVTLLSFMICLFIVTGSYSCGFRYMPKPKVVVEGEEPQSSFYAAVIALNELGYRIEAVDTVGRTILTEKRTGRDFWWQVHIAVAENGHVAIETSSSLERQRGAQTITHKGIVSRAIRISKYIQRLLYTQEPQRIIADGSSLLPSMIVTEETRISVPGG